MNTPSSNIPKVVIIIPCYNEAEVIKETIISVMTHTQNLERFSVEILIFDSNSTDTTLDEVKLLKNTYANLHHLSEPVKSGLGSAYIQAMQYAMTHRGADIVVEYDADGSHQPQYLPEMLEKFNQAYDVVIGSRYIKGGSIPKDWGIHRQLLSVMGNQVAQLFLSSQYKDFTSGFRATRCSYLKKIDLNNLLSKQYAYKIHLAWALHKAGARIVEHPIAFIDRKKGYSKLPKHNIVDSLRVVILLRLRELKEFWTKILG